jgi:hypothetical protein
VVDVDAEHVGEGGEQVDVGGERVAGAAAGPARPGHEERGVAERLELRDVGLAPDVAAVAFVAEVVAVVGADHEGGVVPEAALVEGIEDAAEPVASTRSWRVCGGPRAR